MEEKDGKRRRRRSAEEWETDREVRENSKRSTLKNFQRRRGRKKERKVRSGLKGETEAAELLTG